MSEELRDDTPEDVSVEGLSDGNLDELLSKSLQFEEEDEEEELSEESEPESDEVEEQPEDEAEAEAEEKLSPETKEADSQEALAKKLEELQQKRLAERQQRETYIQRLKTELGQLRAQLDEQRRQLAERYQELRETDPAEAIEVRDEVKKRDAQIEQVEQQERMLAEIDENERVFLAHVQPGEATIEDMADVLKSDGLPEPVIQQFLTNPFATAKGETLVQLAKRAKFQKAAVRLYEMASGLHDENQKLKAEIKKLKGRPEALLRSVTKTAKQIPNLTGARGGSTKRSLADIDAGKLSDTELDAALAKLGVG
jgi:hypothetical protein